ncbi:MULTISPECIES: tyrosine-type recombinase/integrase [Methanothrix]|jgi:integrase/recombinase XerD|uniref:Site-specific integrase/recombinase n=1 Tax=Methanothrix soehngenii (strain ATCC 5969 / DSM 3671 / JCM 10134 / NBRC 103675 / OCM 69 / GP-6) TaxID=990316 RepID=F4BWQ8_METSG|nr:MULTISPECIES: tyrosine-type recombinase/integrase [Methanothrix]AEB68544.1 site-specific integrase/recombinase [Methanothrix soehngenii GP6]
MKLDIDWTIKSPEKFDLDKFRRYLRDHGHRPSTIDSYLMCISKYIQANKSVPDFLDGLHNRKLAGSTIDNYITSIKKYHEMLGQEISIPYLKRSEGIPHYFNEDDVRRIFCVIHNIKHLAMLNVLFYGCLRASELTAIDDEDIDLGLMTLRIRDGKGGRSGTVPLSNECIAVLKEYLQVRPAIDIDGRKPLFYTDRGRRWDRKDLYRMFIIYKHKSNVQKAGGLHVFSRHTPATLMIANGCDIRIVKELLRHRDIRTTLRYAHVADKTLRERYNQCLKL